MNDSIFNSENKQAEILDRILTIGQAIQREITENPKKVYLLVVEATCEMSGADCAVIYPYHPSFGEFYDLDNIAAYGLRHELQIEEKADKTRGLTARVHRAGEILCEDTEQEEPQISEETPFIAREEVKAFMGLSLKVGKNILGILYVDYRKPHHFSEEEKRIIRLFGQQAAMAVSNSWSSRLADIRTETVAKLKTVGQTLVAIEDLSKILDSVLEGIADSAKEVLDADIVDLYQYIQARNEFILPPRLVGERWHPHVPKTKIYDDDVVMKAVKMGEPQYFDDVQKMSMLIGEFKVPRKDAPDQRFVIREGIVSSAMIPLIAIDEVVGVMFVNYRTPQLFGPEQKDVIESFAIQAAIAIYNARLFQLEQQQRQQSDTLREVARIVNTALERDKVIDSVLEQLGRVIEYDSASVQLIEGDHRTLVGGRGFLMGDSPERLRRNISQDPLISRIVQDRQPLVLSDVADEPEWDHIPETIQVNSWIGAPLVVKDQVIGLLTVDHNKAGFYTQESGNIVAAFANQVALAIHNAELFLGEQRRSHNLIVLNGLAIELTRIFDAEKAYQAILDAVADIFDCDYCTIFLVEPDNILVSHIAGGKLFDEMPKLRFAPGEGLAGWAYQQNKSLLVNNTAKDKRYKSSLEKKEAEPRSIILSPLHRGEQVIGVVSADIDRIDAFSEDDLRVLDTLTGYASTALQNIEYFNDFQVLHTVATELAKQPTLEQIYRTAVKSALETLHCRHSTIFMLDKKAGQLVAMDRVGALQPASEVMHFKLGEGLAGIVAETGEAIRVDDAAKHKHFIEGKVKPFDIPRSIVLAPIKIEDEVVGVISADKDEINGFTGHNLHVLEMLALDVGVALENTQLFHELEEHAEALSTLNEIGQTLTSGIRLRQDKILELIYEQTSRLMDANNILIALYDEAEDQISYGLVMENGVYAQVGQGRWTSHRAQKRRTETVIRTGQPLLHRTEAEARQWYIDTYGNKDAGKISRCWLGVPMMVGERVLGVIAVRNPQEENLYDETDMQILSSIASQSAIALDNANLYYEVNQALTKANQDLNRRVEALSTLNKVGQTLTSGLRLKEDKILELIYEQTCALTSSQDMYIALYDEVTEMIRFALAMEKGKRIDIAKPRKTDMERRGKTEEIIFTRRPILHRTGQEAEEWYKQPGHEEFIGRIQPSWIGVPMIVGEKVLGVIAIYDWEREYAYDEHDQQTLLSMASQAAIALDNANLYYKVNQALERHVEALSALNEVGMTLTSGIRLQEENILELIYEQACRLTNPQNMYIALYDDTTQMIRFGLMMEKEQRLEIAKPRKANMKQRGKTEEIIFTKQPLLHKTGQDEKEWYKLPGHKEFLGRVDQDRITQSWMGVPMIVGKRVLGVIAVYDWDQEYAYDEHDQQTLLSMASQAAIALDNASLYYEVNQALERRVQSLNALNEVGKTLTSGIRLKEDEILELIYEQTHTLTDTQDMYIALYDEDEENKEKTGIIRFGLMLEEDQRVTVEPREANMKQRGQTEEIIFTRQPLLHRTKQEVEAWYQEPGHKEFRGKVATSWLGVPMILGEKVRGVIAVYDYEREYVYDEHDLQTLLSIADQAAIALDNANLYYEVNQALERRVEALSALNDVGQTLTSGIRLNEDKILELIYEQTRTLTGTDNIYIALYDERTGQIDFRLLMERGKSVDIKQRPSFAPHQIDETKRGKTDEVILTKKPILHKTRIEEEAWYNQPRRRKYTGEYAASHLAVPMTIGERVIGVIAIYDWEQEYAYDDQDAQILSTMASQAAIAMDNARLFGERERRLELLQQISARMVEAGLDPDEVLELVAQAANDISQSDLTSIYLYDQESACFTRGVQVLRGKSAEQVKVEELPTFEELPTHIAQTQEAKFIDDVQEHPGDFTFVSRHQLRAFAGLPLTITGSQGMRTTVGVLFVNFKQPHPFSDDEREILHHLANQAAVAISHATAQESAQAKEQLATLGTAAAALQHRLSNMLGVILPAVLRLRYRVGDDGTNTNILDTIERNILYATEVIRRMQDPLREEPFVRTNINSLLHDAIQRCLQDRDRFSEVQLCVNLPDLGEDDATVSTDRPQITLVTELQDSLPTTYASSGQMAEVFRVLVENAVKAIHPQAGTVTITSQLTSDQLRQCVEVTVTDTGKGIDEKTQSKLFKQPVPRKEFGEGAGLGLWLSHIIVRSHQGSLRLQSTEINKGSTFLVRLPILDQPLLDDVGQKGGEDVE